MLNSNSNSNSSSKGSSRPNQDMYVYESTTACRPTCPRGRGMVPAAAATLSCPHRQPASSRPSRPPSKSSFRGLLIVPSSRSSRLLWRQTACRYPTSQGTTVPKEDPTKHRSLRARSSSENAIGSRHYYFHTLCPSSTRTRDIDDND